jgi:uncharacterized surface protein with fasciclin (FAS1) repeats
MNSKDHTTLVAAVKAAGLVDTLKGPGPFTVFAPTNAAFNRLPPGTVDTLLKPENKAMLQKVLTYHVVPGRIDSNTLDADIKAGDGQATLKTVEGDTLTFKGSGKDLTVSDNKGDTAKETITTVYQSNGVIMVIDTVLLPNQSIHSRAEKGRSTGARWLRPFCLFAIAATRGRAAAARRSPPQESHRRCGAPGCRRHPG